MNAERFLEDLKKVIVLIENKKAEAEQWQILAEGNGCNGEGERVQTSNNGKAMETAIVNKISAEREVEILKVQLRTMIKTIERLPADEYDLIHKVYVQDFTLKQFARMKNRGSTWASVKHKSAKRHLQEILNEGKVEQNV